ncbi:NUDIX domain-containing protein [Pokkaliibacter sp. CJK22405]|uniref:NUDIX domain-containing protein n=1 Tax=Pokkaliibacter sp. CJK22405 TaxID=3384615 RepID=UPI0039848740
MSGSASKGFPSVRFSRDDVSLVKNEVSFQGFFRMRTLTVNHPRFQGGEMTITRELFERGRAVAVLLFDPAAEAIILVEQFRTGALMAPDARLDGQVRPTHAWQLELVAGIVEEGESDVDVAGREAEEEAGAVARGFYPMLDYLVSPGGTNERVGIYCAWVDSSSLGGVHGLETEGEDIQVHVVPFAEACEACADGRIDNAATLLGVQWFQLYRDKVMANWKAQGLV